MRPSFVDFLCGDVRGPVPEKERAAYRVFVAGRGTLVNALIAGLVCLTVPSPFWVVVVCCGVVDVGYGAWLYWKSKGS
jgi:hypothetical protein